MGWERRKCNFSSAAGCTVGARDKSDGEANRRFAGYQLRTHAPHQAIRDQNRRNQIRWNASRGRVGSMMTETGKGPYLGVDIGGTKVAVGVVDDCGKILSQTRTPMAANGTAETGFDAVDKAIRSVMATEAGNGIQGIG